MEAARVPWRPLGELFVGRGLITEAELETALAEQDATGKRLGEILVDRGLVSGPDLTSALMDQLGVEISKEEGFGSGLWAEIKRRHKRVRNEAEDGDVLGEAEIALVPDLEEPEAAQPEPVAEAEAEAEADTEPEPELEPEPVAVDLELEQEFEEIKADYTPPVEREPEPFAEPELEPEPVAELEPVAESDEAAALRAELAEARTDLAHLQEMLADAMTALAAFHAEAAGQQYGED